MLWNGGLWPWLDPETAIRAVGALAERRPGVRLVFMGAAQQLPAQRTAERAQALAAELGLLDRVVFFNDEWVPYEQRADWLLEADCALSTHEDHLETRFAFRTRVLDCFWARLPIVCTGGDDLADAWSATAGRRGRAGDERASARRSSASWSAGVRLRHRPRPDGPRLRLAGGRAAARADGAGLSPRPRRPGGHSARPERTREWLPGGRAPLNPVGLRDWPRL